MSYSSANGAYAVTFGTNTYSGGTTIASGIVEFANSAAFGSGSVTMTGGAVRSIFGPWTVANDFTLSGTVGFGSTMRIAGAITLAANTTITPSFAVDTIKWTGGLALGSRALTIANTGPNAAGASWAGATLTISGAISGTGRIIQGGSGTLALTGTNSYTGGTTINAGAVMFDNSAALGTGNVTFGKSSGTLIAGFTGTLANNIALGTANARIITTGEALTLSGPISGSGTLQVDAVTLTLSRSVSFTGKVAIAPGARLALTGAGSVFDISGATTQATLKGLTGGGAATSRVIIGGKRLTINGAIDATKVAHSGRPGMASSLIINVASQNFTLATAAFANWTAGQDTIRINGNAQDNTLTGTTQNETCDGGAGVDIMRGGNGSDTYYVDNADDQVVESGTGIDTVRSTVSWTLGGGVENLTLEGSGSINGTGNTLANIIIGNAQSNTIEGAGNADTLTGGFGTDLFVYHAGFGKDAITDFTAGSDKIQFDRTLFADYDAAMNATVDTAAGAVITFDANNAITLAGKAKGTLTMTDFAFVA